MDEFSYFKKVMFILKEKNPETLGNFLGFLTNEKQTLMKNLLLSQVILEDSNKSAIRKIVKTKTKKNK